MTHAEVLNCESIVVFHSLFWLTSQGQVMLFLLSSENSQLQPAPQQIEPRNFYVWKLYILSAATYFYNIVAQLCATRAINFASHGSDSSDNNSSDCATLFMWLKARISRFATKDKLHRWKVLNSRFPQIFFKRTSCLGLRPAWTGSIMPRCLHSRSENIIGLLSGNCWIKPRMFKNQMVMFNTVLIKRIWTQSFGVHYNYVQQAEGAQKLSLIITDCIFRYLQINVEKGKTCPF